MARFNWPFPWVNDPEAQANNEALKLYLDSLNTTATVSAATRVTSLPGSPVDGQEIVYVADAANGVLWPLRYNLSSASAYKWEAVGPTPLYAEDAIGARRTTGSVARLTWVAATAGDPSITVPLAGDYMIVIDGDVSADAACSVYFGARVGATDPTFSQPNMKGSRVTGTTGHAQTIAAVMRVLAVAAAAVIAPRYLHDAVGNQTISVEGGLTMTATPVRVG